MSSGLTSQRTVLLVDDYADSRYMLKKHLELLGYHVVEATNGQEAVEMAERACPDLILLDLNMPVIDGLVATQRIRTSEAGCQNVPIIAITAFDTYGMKEAALEAGCTGYIAKPVDFDQVEKLLHNTLDKYCAIPR